jgi:XTP/dITP diphosphohydrolase
MKIDTIVVGTTNPGKFAEIAAIFAEAGIETLALSGFPALPDVVEDGRTFAENARIKASTYAAALGATVLAEDSGLEVDALSGAPGVHSARFAGEPQDPASNNALLLEKLANVAEHARTARFRCAACLANPSKILAESQGTTEGVIAATHRRRHRGNPARHRGVRLRPALPLPGTRHHVRRGLARGEAFGQPPGPCAPGAPRNPPGKGLGVARRGFRFQVSSSEHLRLGFRCMV